MFVTPKARPPLASSVRWRSATGQPPNAAASELPRVELGDALGLTLLLIGQSELFDRACARWVGRFLLEVRGVGLPTVHLALASLGSLRAGSTAGAHALAELFEALGREDLGETVEAWIARQ